jgi:dTDP-glucose 4,6-dehydratase
MTLPSVPMTGRRLVHVAWDTSAWAIALVLFVLVRYDLSLSAAQWRVTLAWTSLAVAANLVGGFATHLYLGRNRIGSFQDATQTGLIVGGIWLLFGVAVAARVADFPRGIALVLPPLALVFQLAGRHAWRLLVRSARPVGAPGPPPPATCQARALVYGAGDVGHEISRLVRLAVDPPYQLVGFLDDDPGKRRLRVHGGRVLGAGPDLEAVTAATGADTVILGFAHASGAFIQALDDRCRRAGLRLLVPPPFAEVLDRGVRLDQLRQATIDDLLGRRPIQTDLAGIREALRGRVVLVTGAGGSIGSELARQVHSLGPDRLVLLDRDESALHHLELSLFGSGLLQSDDIVLCDVRDEVALRRVFRHHRPDIVFHAAALKHLPMLERFPDEGWKTNVLGTAHVLACAAAGGVRRFVNISTDKAADPVCVLGQTKRLAERLTAHHAAALGLPYVSVRFGNVLGSRGSVLDTFRAQIERGGPVTVTDPNVTRFFMTIPEACELVLQAAVIGRPGDALVLDMGEPVRIEAVARRLIEESGRSIDVVYTGLRPGEKLHEVLFSGGERGRPSAHPLISQVAVPPLDPGVLTTNGEATAVDLALWPVGPDSPVVAPAVAAASPPTASARGRDEEGEAGAPILLSPPDVTAAEEAALVRAIRSGWVAPAGPDVDAFEVELAAYCQRRHAVALSSGTAALHLALLGLGIGPGDRVAVATMTFAATANAVVYTGAEPVFIDCDETGNMSPDRLAEALADLDRRGRPVRAVVSVDLLGKVADHGRLGQVTERHGVPIVSDAAEALGATRDGRPAASFGIAAALSFNGNKIMTTSGGGALLTDSAELAAWVRYLATQARQPVAHYEHSDIGFNYRLSNLLAAVGRAQLGRLGEMLERRRAVRAAYRALVETLPGVTLFAEPPDEAGLAGAPVTRDNCWLTAILLDPDVAAATPEELRVALAEAGIEARPMWKPMHLQPVYAGHEAYVDGTSERLFAQGLCLPSGSALTDTDLWRVHEHLTAVLGRAYACV